MAEPQRFSGAITWFHSSWKIASIQHGVEWGGRVRERERERPDTQSCLFNRRWQGWWQHGHCVLMIRPQRHLPPSSRPGTLYRASKHAANRWSVPSGTAGRGSDGETGGKKRDFEMWWWWGGQNSQLRLSAPTHDVPKRHSECCLSLPVGTINLSHRRYGILLERGGGSMEKWWERAR